MIDAHFHVWKLDRGDYDWLTPALTPIYRDIGVDDWIQNAKASGVTRGIIVQAAPTEAETTFILQQAARHPGAVLGVVGWVDFAAPDAPDRIRAIAGNPLLKGLRPMLQDIADPDWILRSEVVPALETICDLGLTFDALIKPVHLSRIPTLAARFPRLRIVVDHAAKPDIASGGFQDWADGVRRIAVETTAYCKLSGLLTEAGMRTDIESIRPYAEYVMSVFGPDRVLWGSDWPVLELAAAYEAWHSMATDLVPEQYRAPIFETNAIKAYALG